MLSHFRMNVSHNLLSKLTSNSNFSTKDLYVQSNIKVNSERKQLLVVVRVGQNDYMYQIYLAQLHFVASHAILE